MISGLSHTRWGRRGGARPLVMAMLALAAVLLALALGPLPTARAAGIVVDATNSAVAADGQCSLAEAIANANDDAATYADCLAGAGADTITLAVPVDVDGATLFPAPGGPGVVDFGASGLPEVTTEITIAGNAITRTGAGDYRFMVVRSTGNLTLEGVTMSNGRVAGNCNIFSVSGADACGGALVVYGGTLTLLESTLSNNTAVEVGAADITMGGAIYVVGGSLSATTSSFTDNAAEYGGAIAALQAVTALTDSTFDGNTAVASGGAVYNGLLSEMTVAGSTFSDNHVTAAPATFNGGGAIDNAGSSCTLVAVNSLFDGNSAANGGAILNFNASDATLVNTTLTNNSADQGGAILNRGSGATLTLFSSTVSDNTAAFIGGGGGISNGGTSDTGIAHIHDSAVTGNISAGHGGGIRTLGILSIVNSAVDGNRAAGNGGGIFVGSMSNQTVDIAGSSVSDNFANSNGGGLYYTQNPTGSPANILTVADSVFDGNEADEGGGIFGDTVHVTISGSTLSSNTATNVGLGGGGGIHMRSFITGGATLAIRNSTVSGNMATQDGGGVYLNGSALTAALRSVTIAGNTANSTNGGDGLHSLAAVAAVVVSDTIVDANSSRNCLDTAGFGVTDGGHNISSDTTCGFADTGGVGIGDGVNPLLAALSSNGSSTETHALGAGSPAIDHGSVSCPATDQRGAARTAACDIGAYEAPASTASLSIAVDTAVIYEAGETSATVTVTLDNTGPDAKPLTVVVPLAVTGDASGLAFDYTLSNQAALGEADAGSVEALTFDVAAGATASQDVTITAVDDTLIEPDEDVVIAAGVIGNASFSGSNAVSVTIVSDDALDLVNVLIDIKPGSYPNSINVGNRGTVPVAILSSPTFDAATVDPATITLAGAGVRIKPNGRPQAALEDVNGDGLLDLVAHIPTHELDLSAEDVSATLDALTYGGVPVTGSDSVWIVPVRRNKDTLSERGVAVLGGS